MGARLLALTSAIALTIAIPAFAQTRPPHVEIGGDRGALDATKVDDLVALELGADAARIERITMTLHEGRADVDVLLAAGEHRRGSIAIAATEPERALALFVAELARGAATPPPPEAPPPPPTTTTTTAPPAPPPPPPEPVSAPETWRFSAIGAMGARLVTTGGALLPTPHLEIGARRDALRIGGIARYAYASSDDVLGTVSAHALATGGAVTYVLVSTDAIALATGPRIELGAAFGRGSGTNGDRATAFTFAGSWAIELHVKAGGLSVFGALEAGSFLRGVELHADDRDVLHLSGPFVGASIGAML